MAESNSFTEAVRASRKDKVVVAEVTNSPAKRLRPSGDMIVLPPPPSQPLAEELAPPQPKPLVPSASISASAPVLPIDSLSSFAPVDARSSLPSPRAFNVWPWR